MPLHGDNDNDAVHQPANAWSGRVLLNPGQRAVSQPQMTEMFANVLRFSESYVGVNS